jgi:hypothetical protein
MLGVMLGRLMAERGFQVLIQSTRGTSGATRPSAVILPTRT